MYYLTDFKHFVSIFPSFSIQLNHFSINFKFFDLSFLQKLRSDWVHFFSCAVPGYRKIDRGFCMDIVLLRKWNIYNSKHYVLCFNDYISNYLRNVKNHKLWFKRWHYTHTEKVSNTKPWKNVLFSGTLYS